MKQIFYISILLFCSLFGNSQELQYKDNDEIVIFYGAEWCGPCTQTKEILKEQDLVNYFKQSNKKYFYIDIDTKEQKLKQWIDLAKVKTIPTIIRYKFKENKWNEYSRIVGLSSKTNLLNFLKNEK